MAISIRAMASCSSSGFSASKPFLVPFIAFSVSPSIPSFKVFIKFYQIFPRALREKKNTFLKTSPFTDFYPLFTVKLICFFDALSCYRFHFPPAIPFRRLISRAWMSAFAELPSSVAAVTSAKPFKRRVPCSATASHKSKGAVRNMHDTSKYAVVPPKAKADGAVTPPELAREVLHILVNETRPGREPPPFLAPDK